MAADRSAPVPKLVRQRYPDVSLSLTEGGAAVIAATDAAASGGRSGVLVWPGGFPEIGAAFGVAALRAQEAGETTFRALVFPWRGAGTTGSMSSLMADETPVAKAALGRAGKRATLKAARTPADRAKEAYDVLAIRMKSLSDPEGARKARGARSLPSALRHPTLDELFPVFAPPARPGDVPTRGGSGFMARIRGYTDVGEMLGRRDFDSYAALVEDPVHSPYSLHGMPGASRAGWQAAMNSMGGEAPRMVFLDLGEAGRKALGKSNWREKALAFVADAEARWPGIGIVAVTDTPKASRDIANPAKGKAIVPVMVPVLSGIPALTTAAAPSGGPRKTTRWIVAPKDKSLEKVVHDSLNMMHSMYGWGQSAGGYASDAVQERMLRMANSPCGWGATRKLLEGQHDGDIPQILMGHYFPSVYLSRVLEAARAEDEKGEAANGAAIRTYVNFVQEQMTKMRQETPVANKLRGLLPGLVDKKARKIALAFRNSDMCELFRECFLPSLPTDVRAGVAMRTVPMSRSNLKVRLADGEGPGWDALIMVNPEQGDIGLVMSCPRPPPRALVLTDAYSAQNLANQMDMTSRIVRDTSWGEDIAELVRELRDGISNLPDLRELFEDGRREAAEARPQAVVLGSFADLVLVTDDGTEITCGSATTVLLHDAGMGAMFRRARACEVGEGDTVLVPSDDVSPTLTDALAKLDRDDAEQRRTLAVYHTEVRRRVAALPWDPAGPARVVLAAMKVRLPETPDRELANISRWIAVKPGQDVPCAPEDFTRFAAFASSLGIAPDDAGNYWSGAIEPWRALKKENGQNGYHRAIGYLADPDSAAMHLTLGPDSYDAIMTETLSRMRRVTEIRRAPAPEEELEAAPARRL